MAAKPEAKPAPAAAEGEKPAAPAAAAAPSGLGAWIPAIAAIVLAPALTFAVAQFVLIPRLEARLAHPSDAAASAAPEAKAAHDASSSGGHGKEREAMTAGSTFEFTNVVVNLAGTMGTRYLKTSFSVSGKGVKPAFDAEKPRLTDVTLSVLSSLTLAELEEPGAKNVLREKLVAAYNQTLGRTVAEQVYFSDFVVQ